MSLPITTTSTMAANNEADSDGTRSMNNNNEKKKKKEKWIQDSRGSLMVVATVIASLTFQIAINPPGGVWQSDTDKNGGCAENNMCRAGTSVLAFGSTDQKIYYEVFILLCTLSFSASLTTILFLMTPLSSRIVIWGCIITMFISVICLAAAYIIAILMVIDPFKNSVLSTTIIRYYMTFWGAIITWMCAFYLGKMDFLCRKSLLNDNE